MRAGLAACILGADQMGGMEGRVGCGVAGRVGVGMAGKDGIKSNQGPYSLVAQIFIMMYMPLSYLRR